ncbi:MAG TPA: branched-chain amino acid ABC transporter permease [Acidimicrobiia bacterium]
MRLGRPGLISDYATDTAIFRSNVARFWFTVLLVVVVVLGLGGAIPLGFMTLSLDGEAMFLLVTALFASVAAIGLNIVTGIAGQVSLGHAFFLGLGAFTAALLGGVGETRQVFDLETGQFVQQTLLLGFELDMLIWLPAAGIVAALAGLIVAPVAFRLRGLYLAVVTLGLVFLGEHLFREWDVLTGGVGIGRPTPSLSLLGFRFDQPGEVLGFMLDRQEKLFVLGLILLLIFGLAAKNLTRSKIGRALSAIRDRDIAASMMGIDLSRYKTVAFVISSFYAGVAGALLYTVIGRLQPESFNLLLSVEYIAMILIGGVATVSGAIMGAAFITFLPLVVRWLAGFPVFGFISTAPGGNFPTVAHIEEILFGVLIVVFLIFEPLGLYGIWIRIRNYWKAWPFSY